MQGLNAFLISFCSSCILLGFTYMLCPSGNMSNSVKYVFCLCFVCSVIATAISIPSPNFEYFNSIGGEELLTEQNVAITAKEVFCEALTSQNINFRKIVVDTNKLQNDSIIISKVTVYTNDDAQKINQIIGSDSYEVEIINE